jgi:hypothetical protein
MDRLNELAASIEVGINKAAIAQARTLRGIDLAAGEIVRRMDERHAEITGWPMQPATKAAASVSMTAAVEQVVQKFGDRLNVTQWQDSAWLSLAGMMFSDADQIFAIKTLNAHRIAQKKHDDRQAGIAAQDAVMAVQYGHAPTTRHASLNEGRALDAAGAMIEITRRENAGRQFPAKRKK